ncbi:MAG: isocitrate lyase/phosphoenolpyruvate mutase family protein [Pseudomonadota bacterium]
MTQTDTARAFHALHDAQDPLILYNAWDAATARACAAAGSRAVATGSHSVAQAHGYADGQEIPFSLLLSIVERMAASVDVPLSVDFEGGYADTPDGLADNLTRLVEAGAVGVNVEDQRIGGDGLYTVSEQAARIAVLRRAAEACGVPVFINARTDLFLKETDASRHDALMEEAVVRARAYADAGASGFFAPRVADGLVARLADAVPLPLNIMAGPERADAPDLSRRGVARISYGPFPFIEAMQHFGARAGEVLS